MLASISTPEEEKFCRSAKRNEPFARTLYLCKRLHKYNYAKFQNMQTVKEDRVANSAAAAYLMTRAERKS